MGITTLLKGKDKTEIEHYLNDNDSLNAEFLKIIYETKEIDVFGKAVGLLDKFNYPGCPIDILEICNDLSSGYLVGPFVYIFHTRILELLVIFEYNDPTFVSKVKTRIMISEFDNQNFDYYIGLQRFRYNLRVKHEKGI